jgi:hypothetical protein
MKKVDGLWATKLNSAILILSSQVSLCHTSLKSWPLSGLIWRLSKTKNRAIFKMDILPKTGAE